MRRRAFTLLELLVAIAIIALLLSIMLPAMQACNHAGRHVKCLSQLRMVAWDFGLFADPFAVANRGDSTVYGPKQFMVEDFQQKLYAVDEYWDLPQRSYPATYDRSEQLMMCPEGPRLLKRFPFQQSHRWGFVRPHKNVSLAFNMRLHARANEDGQWVGLIRTIVTSKILDHPNVPLLMDVDGVQAADHGESPYFIAPPAGEDDPYSSGAYWFPSFRHQGRINVAFVGGHVLSSRDPVHEPGWDWSYRPLP